MNRDQFDLLELIINKQNSNPEIKILIEELLYAPWHCSNKLIDKYVTMSLAKILKKYKKHVLYNVFFKKKYCYIKTDICGIEFVLKEQITGNNANFLPQINLYKEIISNDLEKENIIFNKLSLEGQASLIGLYILAIVAIYDICEIIENNINTSKKPHLKIKKSYLNAYLIRQFRFYCNQNSINSDYCLIYKQIKKLHDLKKNSNHLKKLTYYLVDKTLSINSKYIERPFSHIFQQLFERCQLLTYLICYFFYYEVNYYQQNREIELKQISIQNIEIIKAGFKQNEIDSLISDIGKRIGFYNTVLEKTDINGHLNLKKFNLYYTFNIHAKSLLDNSLRTQKKWFEQSYLIPYLMKELNGQRFIIGKGFQRLNKYRNQLPNYDIDVVIYDKKTDLIYFCQLKHKIDFLMTSFRHELKTFSSNIIQNGVNQLIGLTKIINHDLIKEQLITAFQNTPLNKSYIKKYDLSKNSRFILIHNMQDFDFCCYQGIIMYEWNTWRNLLKGFTFFTKIRNKRYAFTQKTKELIVDFSDLKQVKENSQMNDSINSNIKISKEYLELTIYTHSKFSLFNKKIYLNRQLECVVPYFN